MVLLFLLFSFFSVFYLFFIFYYNLLVGFVSRFSTKQNEKSDGNTKLIYFLNKKYAIPHISIYSKTDDPHNMYASHLL